ncbi:Cation-transporting P-type ATPase A [Corynebacterium provencense]|uniref:Cation-transporting P-type ATPase A n=1 Tax=Corynebacterium provencense TaxID=1737425 RepID=A0A2Z3YTH5_9CORY|nr:Cation-transporting P-type ATPase A [Corynebacterium provencense]
MVTGGNEHREVHGGQWGTGQVSAASRAIEEARDAARAAGLLDRHSGSGAEDRADDAQESAGPLTSFTWHLSGLESAVEAGQVEAALCAVPGVQARVVYSTSMAWVTAPDDLSPDVLRDLMAGMGVDAWLTTASLRRRAERLNISERRRRMRRARRSRQRPRSFQERERHATTYADIRREKRLRRRGYGAGTGGSQSSAATEVLYTARDLITIPRLIVAVVLGLPVVVLQHMPGWQFDRWQWLCLALSLPVVTWCAWPFHRAMLAGLRRGMSALDTASSVAILVSFIYSLVTMLVSDVGDAGWRNSPGWTAGYHDSGNGSVFLDVACGVTILLLLGRLASRRTRLRSSLALGTLRLPGSDTVTVVRNDRRGKPVKSAITVGEIRVGDDILVPPGGIVPSDGEVVGGRAMVDAGPFGGRDRRIEVTVNSPVYAGARNCGDTLKIRVERTGSRTRLAAVNRWIAAAERDENRLDQLATRSASLLVPWAVVVAVGAAAVWLLVTDSPASAVAAALAVLISVAPLALAVSTTLALRLGLARAAAGGTLLRNANTIHQLADVDTVIFNRNGTLTHGPMTVTGITAAKGENPELVLRVAGALSLESNHAVSRAIVRADREARDAGTGGDSVPHWLETGPVVVDEFGSFTSTVEIPVKDPKTGETATRHLPVALWRPRDLSELSDPALANAAVSGGTPLVVSWKDRARGVINVSDQVKGDAAAAVETLEEMDIETTMIARDTYPVARRMADMIGISTVLAGIAPGRKAATVRSVHAQGAKVAMVGDQDVLDCLRVADVGMLMGSADRIDNAESDVVIIREDISAIPEVINLVRHVRATVDWNLWLSWGYNIAALLLSVTGLLNPLVATVPMLLSSLLIEWRSARITHRDYTTRTTVNADWRPRWVRFRSWAGENLLPWQTE